MELTESDCKRVTLEAMKDDAPDVWEHLRTYDPADLQAVQRWVHDEVKTANEDLTEALSDEEPEEALQVARRIGKLKIRESLAQIQMQLRVEMLADEVPKWGGFDAMIPPRVKDAMTDGQEKSVKRKSAIRVEFSQRMDEGQGVTEARRELSDKHHVSESTIRDYTTDLT